MSAGGAEGEGDGHLLAGGIPKVLGDEGGKEARTGLHEHRRNAVGAVKFLEGGEEVGEIEGGDNQRVAAGGGGGAAGGAGG